MRVNVVDEIFLRVCVPPVQTFIEMFPLANGGRMLMASGRLRSIHERSGKPLLRLKRRGHVWPVHSRSCHRGFGWALDGRGGGHDGICRPGTGLHLDGLVLGPVDRRRSAGCSCALGLRPSRLRPIDWRRGGRI